jgi:translocation and assembly module TamB
MGLGARERGSRVGRWLVRVLVGLLLLLALLPVLVLFALRLELVRARVAATVDSALAETFRGRIRIDEIRSFDFNGVAARARVSDETGRTVVRVDGLEARVFWPKLLLRALSGQEPLTIELDEVRLEHAEVELVDDGSGAPTLAGAFQPRAAGAPASGPGPIVSIRRIFAEHIWVHGGLGGLPPLDAEVSSVGLSLHLDERGLLIPVERATLVARGLPAGLDPNGTLRGRLELPEGTAPIEADASYTGLLAGTAVEARFSLAGDELSLTLDAPEVEPAALARFSPELELSSSAKLEASVFGTLPELRFGLDVTAEAARVEAQGTLYVDEPLELSVELAAQAVDLGGIVRGAPATDLDLRGRLAGTLTGEAIEASYEVTSDAGRVAGTPLPALATTGELHSDAAKLVVVGNGEVDEPGARTRASYRLELRGERGSIALDATTKLEEPARLAALAGVRVSGTLAAAFELALPEMSLDGRVGAELEGASAEGGAIGRTAISANVTGSLADPLLVVRLDGHDVRARGQSFERARLRAAGTPERIELEGRLEGRDPDELWFRTTLTTGTHVELAGTELGLVDRDGPLKLSARRLVFGERRLALDDFVLEGAGRAELSLERTGARLHGRARALDVDLARLARVAGVTLPVKGARITLDARYDADSSGTSGFVVGSVADLAYADVKQGSADIDLRLVSERLDGTVIATLAPGARVAIAFDDVVIPGPPFRLPPPDRMLGRVAVRGTLDLHALHPLLAVFPEIPLGDARGRVRAEVVYERRAERPLVLEAHVQTTDLELLGKLTRKEPIETTDEAIAASTWNLRDIDLRFDLELAAAERRIRLSGAAFDEDGDLVELEASAAELPAELSVEMLARVWRDVPIRASVQVPRRRFRKLPQPLRPDGTNGTVELTAELSGTATSPRLVASGTLGRLRAAGVRAVGERRERLDLDFALEYERRAGKLSVSARDEAETVARLSGTWEGDALRLDPERPDAAFAARIEASFDELNLDTVAALRNRQIGGELSGDALVEFGKGERRLSVDLKAAKLALGQVTLDSVRAGLVARDGELRGDVTVRGEAGSLDAAVRSGLTWRDRIVPQPTGDIDATLDARAFRLAALWPLTSSSLSELDGRLNAKLGARVRDGRLKLTGAGKLEEGVVQLPAIGQRFDRISARIEVTPEEIRLRDVRAHGLEGALTAASVIRFDERLALREVSAAVRIAERQRIPVTFEGVAIGDAWGSADARFVRKPEGDEVAVKLANFHLQVPDADQHGVQSLKPAEGVRIGVRQRNQQFVALPVQPLERGSSGEKVTPMTVSVDLGKALSVRRGDLVDVQLTGRLEARIAEETQVVGRVQVAGGTLDVSGKRFEIERGTVSFTGGDPANPTVTALARWDSPAGYSVYAEYAGTAENGHLTLRSEPPLSEDQVITLLMFGTPDGSFAGDSSASASDTAAGAVGVAGSTAAKGLNRALSRITRLDVQARVDTSTGSARPEIVVALSPRLSARVTRAIGEPSPGTSPDRTFLTLELRLKRNWALSGLVGDRGASALDLIWRHRY